MSNEGADATHQLRTRNSYDCDVFISYSREDTRFNFTAILYDALNDKKIKTFPLYRNDDYDVPKSGDQLSPSIFKAIQESTISIVVLSQKYASSLQCLNELLNILECMRMNNQQVWPIFYKVKPWEVKSQGDELEKRFQNYTEKVPKWKAALDEVANLTGWFYETRSEDEFIQRRIVKSEEEFIQRIVELSVQSLPRYDVFLSFSGEDTRYSFTGFLYQALHRNGVKVFMDDEGLKGGNQISQTLIKTIERSRFSIIVFSENYGYSSWCLDELVKIIECKETKNQLVLPIFYKVEQSDVSNQTKSYGDAMAAHENRFGKDSVKVQKWRSALSAVSFLEGEHLNENEYEHQFIEKIVKRAIDVGNHS